MPPQGELSQNWPYSGTGEHLPFDKVVVHLLWNIFLCRLVEQVDPRLAIVIGQSHCFSHIVRSTFLHHHHDWQKWCYFVLNIAYDYVWCMYIFFWLGLLECNRRVWDKALTNSKREAIHDHVLTSSTMWGLGLVTLHVFKYALAFRGFLTRG